MSSKITLGQERLRTLYAILKGIPDSRLHLASWRECGVSDRTLFTDCGTTACAVGWACAYPEFQRQGLHFGQFRPELEGLTNWDAVEHFFQLTREQAQALFQASSEELDMETRKYADKVRGSESLLSDMQQVRRRIRRHLLLEGVITAERNAELASEEGVPE